MPFRPKGSKDKVTFLRSKLIGRYVPWEFDRSNLLMKRKSSSKPETEETVALVFAVKNMFPAEDLTAETGEKAETWS